MLPVYCKRLIVVQKTVEELINISSHADFRGFISSESCYFTLQRTTKLWRNLNVKIGIIIVPLGLRAVTANLTGTTCQCIVRNLVELANLPKLFSR